MGGPRPYLAWQFSRDKSGVPVTDPHHRAVKVVIVPLADYRRLKAALEEGTD